MRGSLRKVRGPPFRGSLWCRTASYCLGHLGASFLGLPGCSVPRLAGHPQVAPSPARSFRGVTPEPWEEVEALAELVFMAQVLLLVQVKRARLNRGFVVFVAMFTTSMTVLRIVLVALLLLLLSLSLR